jgi:putative transposase
MAMSFSFGGHSAMALRWTAAGMMEADKGFRRLKAYNHLAALRAALAAYQSKYWHA